LHLPCFNLNPASEAKRRGTFDRKNTGLYDCGGPLRFAIAARAGASAYPTLAQHRHRLGNLAECDNGRVTVQYFPAITIDPAQMGGVACVRGLRIPVATVLRLLAGGRTEDQILSDYPDLRTEDIRECLRFAAACAMERELPLSHPA
jgi:uncharacterized protein (DUF433 family)